MHSYFALKKEKIGILLFILLSTIYFLSAKGFISMPDSNFSVRTAKALIKNHSLEIKAKEHEEGYCYKTKEGKIYSKYGILLPLLWVPCVVAGKAIAAFVSLPEERLTGFLISFYNIFFGAGACVTFFYFVRIFSQSNKVSLSMALLLGLATLCWRYSVSDFSEVTQMFFLLTAVYCILRNSGRSLCFGSFLYGLLFLLKFINIIYLPIFIVFIYFKNNKENKLKHILLFLSFVVVFLLAFFFTNYIRFHNMLETGYGKEATLFYLRTIPKNSIRLLFSFNKGIFIYCPILLFAILGYLKFFKSYPKETMLFCGIIMLNLLFYASYIGWHGDWSFGPRHLVSVVPFYLLPMFNIHKVKGFCKLAILVLIFISFAIQFSSILVSDQEYHTIRYNIVYKEYRKKMPPDIAGIAILLKHKLVEKNNIYRMSEFGFRSNQEIEDGEFETFRGLNLWYSHLAREYNRPILRFIPLLFLPLLLLLLKKLIQVVV